MSILYFGIQTSLGKLASIAIDTGVPKKRPGASRASTVVIPIPTNKTIKVPWCSGRFWGAPLCLLTLLVIKWDCFHCDFMLLSSFCSGQRGAFLEKKKEPSKHQGCFNDLIMRSTTLAGSMICVLSLMTCWLKAQSHFLPACLSSSFSHRIKLIRV